MQVSVGVACIGVILTSCLDDPPGAGNPTPPTPDAVADIERVDVTPGCDPLIQGWAQWKGQFDLEVDQFVTGPFAEKTLTPMLEMWRDQITAVVAEQEAAGIAATSDTPDYVLTTSLWLTRFEELQATVAQARLDGGFAY